MTRRQCAKCPWKVTTNPHDIPNDYCEKKHAALKNTIAEPASINNMERLRIMACHESHEVPCVGWLIHQLGDGNNIALRLAAAHGRIDVDVETVGEQHETFEETLP